MARRRWSPVRVVALSVVVVLVGSTVAGAVVFGRLWFQRPPMISVDGWVQGESGVVQLWGDCCQRNPEHMRESAVASPLSERDVVVRVGFREWLDGTRAWVEGDRVWFNYALNRSIWENQSPVNTESLGSVECSARGLTVGDTVRNGPAVIEVVAIHDQFFKRNNAVDLRVSFDLDGVDAEPFDESCPPPLSAFRSEDGRF